MEPEFYGDLVYKLKKLIERNGFSHQFRKLVMFYKRIGYSLDVMRPSACLVFNPLMIVCYASIFNSTLHDYGVDLVGWDRSVLSVAWPTVVQLVFFFSIAPDFSWLSRDLQLARSKLYLRVFVFDSSWCLS